MTISADHGAPPSGGAVDAAVIADLVAANRILADQGVLDGFGHVSLRHPGAPNRYLLSRSRAPALVSAADIMEFDLDSNPVDQGGRLIYIERFIHGEIYKARADVGAVVHSHSPSVIPFSVSSVALRPICHMSAFIPQDIPNFEMRAQFGMTDLLVRNRAHGAALARALGGENVALMRGHGNVCVGPNVMIAVYRAVYTEINARLQAQAIALGGQITFLDTAESALIAARGDGNFQRPWEMWKSRVHAG